MALERFWLLYFTIQILCYVQIYSVPFPANTELLLDVLTRMIEFELLNAEFIIQTLFDAEFKFDFIIREDESWSVDQKSLIS